VLGYLRALFPLPEGAATPSEIGAALVELRVPREAAEQVAAVLRGCDRARFAPPEGGDATLATAAQAAITRLEAIA
jgi:anthranilate phosphoribosyltransferase